MASLIEVRYVLDTSILIPYIRESALGGWLEKTYRLTSSISVPLISIVTVGELRSLSLQRSWSGSKLKQLDYLLNLFSIINLDFPNLVENYDLIDDYSIRKGAKMGKNDIWIAATAATTGARLLTSDKDFDHLPQDKFFPRDYIDPNTK